MPRCSVTEPLCHQQATCAAGISLTPVSEVYTLFLKRYIYSFRHSFTITRCIDYRVCTFLLARDRLHVRLMPNTAQLVGPKAMSVEDDHDWPQPPVMVDQLSGPHARLELLWHNFTIALRHVVRLQTLEAQADVGVSPMHVVQKDETVASIARVRHFCSSCHRWPTRLCILITPASLTLQRISLHVVEGNKCVLAGREWDC